MDFLAFTWTTNSFLFIFLFIYSYVHTLFGPFVLPAPNPLPLTPGPLTSRQNLFCPLLQFCWRVDISNNKKDIAFLLVEIKVAIQRFLALLPCTCVLQPELIVINQFRSDLFTTSQSPSHSDRCRFKVINSSAGVQAWTLDWGIMELAKPLHSRSLQSLSYCIFPRTLYLDLCSHISLKKTTCCVCIPVPWCKTRKGNRTIWRLPDARLINTLDKVSCMPWWFQNWCVAIKLL
jgi:hypothetical protein